MISMTKENNSKLPENPEPESDTVNENELDAQPKGKKETLYDKIPLTVKQLDIIIAILLIAFVVFLVIGTLRGNGIL